ncbi:hypothetical protein C8Q76DRAFT_286467 [Earliella scabrosa]|nr:hypothetical protein C8Q76DRAFT_286467 [Earliella scabrosa]
MDASSDATRATELDPGYAKAWGRLASARIGISRYDLAVKALKRALAAMPSEDLTPAQEKQRDHYEQELAVAQVKLTVSVLPGVVTIENSAGKLPWDRAAALLPELCAQGIWDSSAWIIDHAYHQWKRAVDDMNQGRSLSTELGTMGYMGRRGVVEELTNALLSDTRVFHISDNDFLVKWNKQMKFELTHARAPEDWMSGGAKRIIEDLPRRVSTEGWNYVRPALSLMLRSWIMIAHLQNGLRRNVNVALEFLNSTLEVLAWGRERYKNVPDGERGVVFLPTFIRGIKCLRLDMLMSAYAETHGKDPKYPLQDLLTGADEILSELSPVPEQPHIDCFGFYHAFFRYPAAQAHAIRGFYYRNSGLRLREAHGDAKDVSDLFRKAALEYMQAVKYYPMDDERYAWFISCAFNAHWDAGVPLKYLLVLLDQLHKSIPLMKRIWEFSADASSGRDAALQQAMETRQGWLDDINSGRISREELEGLIVQRVVR